MKGIRKQWELFEKTNSSVRLSHDMKEAQVTPGSAILKKARSGFNELSELKPNVGDAAPSKEDPPVAFSITYLPREVPLKAVPIHGILYGYFRSG